MRKAIVLLMLSITSASAELSKLEALSMIESGNDDSAVGGAGEVSRYQIKPWIWRQYSASEAYRNRHISSEVAEKFLADLEKEFRKRTEREPNDFDVYVLWNAGPTYYAKIGFNRSRVHPIIQDRARRYANLRQIDRAQAQVVKAAPPPVAQTGASAPQTPPSAAVSRDPEPLWPVLPLVPDSGLQNPMFSVIPLPVTPEPPSLRQQSLLAIGGLQPK